MNLFLPSVVYDGHAMDTGKKKLLILTHGTIYNSALLSDPYHTVKFSLC